MLFQSLHFLRLGKLIIFRIDVSVLKNDVGHLPISKNSVERVDTIVCFITSLLGNYLLQLIFSRHKKDITL